MDIEAAAPLAWFDGPDGRKIAHRFLPGMAPAVVFLPGYKSDMSGGKAQALLRWAAAQGRACLLLDYSGCGQSSGDFSNGTLSRWRDEVVALIRAKGISRAVLCGSSMGGWLMLLVVEALPDVVAGLAGLAPAPDFTDWGIAPGDAAALCAGQIVWAENPYGPEPTPTYPGFWADGQKQLRLGGEIAFSGPVRLIHGQADGDVPWEISLRLARALRSSDVQVHLIKDGDHRLSRQGDIAVLLATLGELLALAG
ncbi:alpha/beta hydrolase [Novosphingobium sp. Chol11]|uniref:alpha/beta fold hydrolase n=1 Tax=Novosphingobium sp. Chol11 TaxID=1385763 RepID=UPI0025E394A0|nr:alpha/beta hydrolase [Novosphingobium sp. Chol11]